MLTEINIARDFSQYPGGRTIKHGPHSGEKFLKECLLDVMTNSNETVTIYLDGTYGYPVSFLEEAFGGIVRLMKAQTVEEIIKRFKFISDENPAIINRIIDLMQSARG